METVKNEFVTRDNINELFAKYEVPRDFDMLTVDVDYNDYWIWRSILHNGTWLPRLVCVDFNPDVDITSALTVEYKEDAEWDGTTYTVASLLAYVRMANNFGYEYVYSLEMGSHAFFVRRDLLHVNDWGLPLKTVKKMSHLPDPQQRQFRDVTYDFLPPDVLLGQRGCSAASCAANETTAGSLQDLASLWDAVR
jgi:hypothetical protein